MVRKAKRIKLSPTEYKKLKLLVFKRDKWRCRMCGNRNDLHAHHVRYRSNQGDDTAFNLITLCSKHHEMIHQRHLIILQNGKATDINADEEVKFERVL